MNRRRVAAINGAMTPTELFTPSGVRLRRRVQGDRALNWLMLPGGPGIGSESLQELADALDVPGSVWMVDLPGDGSNTAAPGAGDDPFAQWPGVLVEAAQALPNCVYVGHSTGGMYLLATPQLEAEIVGLALISSAPDASWRPRYVAMTQADPLPEVAAAAAVYERAPANETLLDLAVASAPWNFEPLGLAAGRDLLARMPYNGAAVDWSDKHFDHTYRKAWWPQRLPTLIVSGECDRIVWQGAWEAAEFQGANVTHATIAGGGHFPWIENPGAVREAFSALAERVCSPTAHTSPSNA
jgi:pimeloyl-ACP methyl ester carboxylesterase